MRKKSHVWAWLLLVLLAFLGGGALLMLLSPGTHGFRTAWAYLTHRGSGTKDGVRRDYDDAADVYFVAQGGKL